VDSATPHAATYGLREAAELLGLSPARIRGWVRAGLIEPRRGARGELRLDFRDLAFLRRVRDLPRGRVSPRRVRRALARLRELLPPERDLCEVRIDAAAGQLVVSERGCLWSPESGQVVFDFQAAAPRRVVALPGRGAGAHEAGADAGLDAEGWYRLGCELEETEPERAHDAYERALALDPGLLDARVNLGCLHHEAGRLAEAESCYRAVLAARPDDATARFDLAVALEDAGRETEAREAYEACLAVDPDCAEAHYNLARLCERGGDRPGVLRHLLAYRRLLG